MDELIKVLGDERVQVANPNKDSRGQHTQLDKNQVKQQLETKKNLMEVSKDLDGKSFKERIEWLIDKKKKGNKLFGNEKYKEATEIYLKGLMGLTDGNSQTEKKEMADLKEILTLNLAMSQFYSGKEEAALSIVDHLIAKGKNSWKTYMKKGIILEKLQRYSDSL